MNVLGERMVLDDAGMVEYGMLGIISKDEFVMRVGRLV